MIHRAEGDAAAHQGRDDLRRRGPGPVPDANGRAAAVAEGSKPVLLHAGAGGLKEGVPMSELKGNFKAAYDVVKRAERCVLLLSLIHISAAKRCMRTAWTALSRLHSSRS